jgi:hypothetical protein
MSRRHFLKGLLGLAGLPLAAKVTARERRPIPLQHSPLAGFQYHHGRRLWPQLRAGQPLQLIREPDNRHDPKAVALHWRGEKIGYLPRVENHAVSQMLDNGRPLQARITRLCKEENPWRRVEVGIDLELPA